MEKKRYEKPAVGQYKSISELPEHLRQQLEKTDLGVIIVDRDLRCVHVSDSFAAELGYKPSELRGRPVVEFTVEETMDVEFFRKALLELGIAQGLLLFKSRDGRKVLVRYRASKQGAGYFANFERVPFAA
jgi:PAS domain S-box-containing protein